MMYTKAHWRKVFTRKREELSSAMCGHLVAGMLQHLEALPLPPSGIGMSFRSIAERNEIPAATFEKMLDAKHAVTSWCYPRLKPGESLMEAVLQTADTVWKTNNWGIEEPHESPVVHPSDIQLVLVPLLAIDQHGQRVGYGKGYYDRFLKHCHPGVVTVGLSWFEPVEVIADINSNDVPLKYCLTPQKLYVF